MWGYLHIDSPLIISIMENRLSFSQIKEMAIQQGTDSNKRAVGMYAKKIGYKRHHTTNKFGDQFYYYAKDE